MVKVVGTTEGHRQRTLLKSRKVDDMLTLFFRSFAILTGKFNRLSFNASVVCIFYDLFGLVPLPSQ